MRFVYLQQIEILLDEWEVEAQKGTRAINEKAQANALQALFETFSEVDWWHGGFQWKWYPSTGSNYGEGSWAKDYTPQGKDAEIVIKKYF